MADRPDTRRLDTVVLTVDGAPLPADLYPRLRLARVEESIQLPDMFTLRFEDAHFELFDSARFVLGTKVRIAFRAEADPLVVTEGEVTAVALEPGSGGRHELVVTGLDLAHRLTRGPLTRTFQNMSDATIARQIAGEYGLDADVNAPGPTHAYVLQAGRTDFAFLRDRAARIGVDVWVSESTLHFTARGAAGSGPPVLRWGENLHGFRVRFSAAERCDEVVVTGWDGVGKSTVVGRAAEADPGSDAPAVEAMAAAAKAAFGPVTRATGRRGVASQDEADALAASLMGRAASSGVVLRGETAGDPRLGAGTTVQLDRVGRQLSGSYRLSSVEHVYGSGTAYVTRFVCGAGDPGGLVDLFAADRTEPLGAGGGGGGGAAPGGSGLGLVIGQVTNNDDPDGLGRVKVTFPTLSQAHESAWARVVSHGAGSRRGLQCIPEVGDEVLAGFEFGDVHRPVVFGGLWSRTDPPPEAHPTSGGTTSTRVLATRRNHRLELVDDPSGAARLSLGDADCRLELTQPTTTLHGEQKVVVDGQNVEITATDKIVLSAAQIEITATGAVTVSGKPIKLN